MNYSDLNLNENLKKGLAECGYVTCTPVQEKVLQVSLDGSDLYVQSQTGTGKTAAYLVTIMQELLKPENSDLNALVLVPTRELAVQVEEEADKIGKYAGLRFASFYGGVGYEKQISDLKKGVKIIIGTPGRIIDLQESKQMDLTKVGFLAVDEADRMFDMGFYPDLRKLIKVLPKSDNRQTMLFSATLNSYVKNLAWEYTKDAKEITIEAENITVDEIDQELIHVSSEDKMSLLVAILQKENPESVLVFCDTKKMCEIVSKRLRINGFENEYIIGDLPQVKRQKIMDNFKARKFRILVATDVAARGIDVNDLAMVVNYDLPNEPENYVHRIGRTARAGKSGKAYTFCSERDVYSLAPIERYIEKQIPSRVAIGDDLAEDKSRDVYIHLDGDKTHMRDDFGRHSKREGRRDSRSPHGSREERRSRERKSDYKSEYNNRRNDEKGKGRRKEENSSRSSAEELNKLAAMTSDERMQYFKEKYEKSSKNTLVSSSKSKNGRKGGNSGRNSSARKNKNAGNEKPKALGNKSSAPDKKGGFLSKIRSFFRHK